MGVDVDADADDGVGNLIELPVPSSGSSPPSVVRVMEAAAVLSSFSP